MSDDVTARDDRLRELAMEATPGPWEADEPAPTWRARDGHVRTTHSDFEDCADEVAETLSNDDAQFIAAASPDVVLELLDRLAAVEAERDRLAAAVERVADELDPGHDGHDATHGHPDCSGCIHADLRAVLSDAGRGK